MELHTTLRLCREHDACSKQYALLEAAIGKGNDDQAIPIASLLSLDAGDEWESVNNAIWALRAVLADQANARDRLARIFAADCAERVLPIFEKDHPDDDRPRKAIEAARAFARGEIGEDELAAARAAAWAAARAAAWDADQKWQCERLGQLLGGGDTP